MGGACDNREPARREGDEDSGWGSPACDNREPAVRTRWIEPAIAERRVMDQPVITQPHYDVVVNVETVSDKKFSFETEMDSSWSLEEIDQVAKARAQSECTQRSDELKSHEIVELVLV